MKNLGGRIPFASGIMSMVAVVAAIASLVALLILQNNDWGYGLLTMSIGSIGLSISAKRYSHISQAIAWAFIIRFVICVIYSMLGDGDADNYGVNAVYYASLPINKVFLNIPTGAYFYSWIISFFFRVFGEYYMPVRVMNATLSVYCVLIFSDIVSHIYKDRRAIIKAAWVIALFPNLIRFSSYFANREVVLLLFMLLYIKHAYLYYNNGRTKHLILSIIALVPAMILHTSMIAMIMLTILIILSRKNNPQNRGASLIWKGFLVSITIITFVYMLSSGIGMEKFGIGGGVDLDVESISNIGEMSAAGRAAYLSGVSFSNPILTLLFLPIRMLYFLYTPFLWMISSAIDIVGLFDAILYIWVSIPMWKQIKEIRRKRNNKTSDDRFIFLLFITLIVIIAMFAAVTSNYGTAIRHRCKLFPIFLLIALTKLDIPFIKRSLKIIK